MESDRIKPPLWLWPNLLSLDAPVVAAVWQILFARCFHMRLAVWPVIVLMATVWLIYSADRVLDSRRGDCASHRHQFYGRNWRRVVSLWTLVMPATAWLALEHFPRSLLERGLLLLGLVGVYLVVVHVFHKDIFAKIWFKEASVGVLFALGASLAAWNGVHTATDAATIVLFAGLCSINCIAIESAESAGAEFSIAWASIAVACSAGALLFLDRPVLGGAEVASAAALLLLNRARLTLSRNALRVLADAALLSPLLFLPLTGTLS